MAGARPLLSRKLDTAYFVFFLIHVPVMLLIDLVIFYPKTLIPSVSLTIRDYYISTYHDPFFIEPTNLFKVFVALEAVYHLPVTFWMLWALPKDDPMVPLNLLVFALEVGITTLACMVEILSWKGIRLQDVSKVSSMYGGYLICAVFMGVDSFLRIRGTIRSKTKQN